MCGKAEYMLFELCACSAHRTPAVPESAGFAQAHLGVCCQGVCGNGSESMLMSVFFELSA